MFAETAAAAEIGFGINPFEHARYTGKLERTTGETANDLRSGVLERCQDIPGVYGMFDEHDRLIYVGKSKQLRSRLRSYFRPGAEAAKQGRIVQFTRSVVWEPAVSEFSALLRELQLIRDRRPRFNVAGQPGRWQPVYICIGRAPAESVFLATNPPRKSSRVYGPFLGNKKARHAVETLNKVYGLRDCRPKHPMVFADDLSLFPRSPEPGCLRFEMQTCLGPCAGGCSQQAYRRRVRAARRFLEGDAEKLLTRLTRQMRKAAESHRFEQAARLRDRSESLTWLDLRLKQLGEARKQFRFVYPVELASDRAVWYLIERGQVMAALEPPDAPAAARRTRRQLEQWQKRGRVDDPHGLIYRTESVMIVTPWFHRRPEELQHALPISEAIKRCEQAIPRAKSSSLPSSAAGT